MMEFEIQLISKETVKPSSWTPESLQKYQLSFLDQIAPPVFMPLVYFYAPTPVDANLSNSADKSNHLKKSLSETLSRFYPLAGRLVDDLYFDCRDQGVHFVEARANCDLSQVIINLIPGNMNKLLPYALHDVQNLGMAVQVTNFRCGGVALGLMISHKIADALSFFLFANTWAAIARNGNAGDIPCLKFQAAELFPPRDVSGFKAGTGIVKEDLVAKVFTFPAAKIFTLRERYSSGDPNRRPTRVEALSAFIWTRFVTATGMNLRDPNKIYTVLHAVNIRNRVEPPLSEEYFGNISRLAIAVVRDEGVEELLQKVGKTIRGVNGEYVAMLREGEGHLKMIKERMAQANKGELVSFNFTSLCRFPVYEADFGWGKPARVGSAEWTYKNLVTFMDTAGGDEGIEAWINLSKEDMDKFEADAEMQEFLAN